MFMPILFLAATTNGYDGSLLNGLQTLDPWQEGEHSASSLDIPLTVEPDFNYPTGATLGLFSAILQVGSFSAIFFSSFIADKFGRRTGVSIGIAIICIGMILQGKSRRDTRMPFADGNSRSSRNQGHVRWR